MGGKTISTSDTKLEALEIQSSTYGAAIPIVGGVTRIAGNLLYYNDFKSIAKTTQTSGKGGGGSVNTTYSYQCNMLMALCHGQVTSIPRIWKGKELFSDSGAATILSTSQLYNVPAIGGSVTVTNSSSFGANTKVVFPWNIGSDSYNTALAEGIDYTQSGGTYTFPSGSIACNKPVVIFYTYTGTAPSGAALAKLGASLFTGALGQAAPSWVTTLHPSDALSYSGLAFLSAQNYPLGSSASVENHNFEVVAQGAYSISSTVPDIDIAGFAVKILKDARYGARIPATLIDDSTNWSNYALANNLLFSPAITAQISAADFLKTCAQLTNTGLVWSAGRLKFIPYGDASATGNGATFTPNTTPIYSLTDDSFTTINGEPPVQITRKAANDAYNHIRIQFNNRSNQYAPEIAEAKDQADIELNGLRSADILKADWVCDATIARNIAQLLLQRSIGVLAQYEFTLPWNFGFLEPMDLVSITDTAQGLSAKTVRITKVEEQDGDLKMTAEDFTLGVASSATYNTQVGAGFAHDYNVAPGSIIAPAIFEAPGQLSGTSGLNIWIAAAGASANWGGCNVWVSMDGTNYRQIGSLSGGSRYGTAKGAVTGGVLSVAMTNGQLSSGSAADSAALTTLCYVGGANPEYLAFQNAALASAANYDLSGLTRGAYGTSATAVHSNGDMFVRCDSGILKSTDIDASYVGKTIHFKFTSFNLYGGAEESLAAVSDYTYTPNGAFVSSSLVKNALLVPSIAAAQNDATTALSNAASALTAANAANAALTNIASDSILSPSEKPTVVQDYAVITAEQSGIDAQATALSITTEKITYDNAVSALTSYLGTLSGWNTIPGSDVAIVGSTFRSKFADVYTTKQALLNKIAAVAATQALWNNVSGSGKPQDNATVGAPTGTFVGGVAAATVGVATTGYSNQVQTLTLGGSQTTYYPVMITSSVVGAAAYYDVAVFRNDVHEDSSGLGSYTCHIFARASSWGHAPGSIIEVDQVTGYGTYNYGVADVFPANGTPGIIVMLRGGMTHHFSLSQPIGAYTITPYLSGYTDSMIGTLSPATTGALLSYLNTAYCPNSPVNWGASVAGSGKPQDNATVGAPSGTYVGGTLAQTVESNAATALANAASAQTAANAANSALTNIASDSILSPSEKPTVVQDYAVITAEQSGIDAQATALSITTEKTTYDNAVSALTSYLGTLSGWNTIPGSDVAIVGSTFRSKFADVYTTKQALLNKIAAVAATQATWTNVASRPTDLNSLNSTDGSKLAGIQAGATVGATLGVNVSGTINSGNSGSLVGNGAFSTNHYAAESVVVNRMASAYLSTGGYAIYSSTAVTGVPYYYVIASITYTTGGYGRRAIEISNIFGSALYAHMAGGSISPYNYCIVIRRTTTLLHGGTPDVIWRGPSISSSSPAGQTFGNSGTVTIFDDYMGLGGYAITYDVALEFFGSGGSSEVLAGGISMSSLSFQAQRYLTVREFQA